MKLLKSTQIKDLKKSKLLKSEVERHRRERMNRSLESLRALLLRGQHEPCLASGRVEKAEILEHTVLLLRNTENTVPREGSERRHFQDGFEACLKQAAQFLKVEGEGREVGRALTDTLSFRRPRPSARDATTRPSACPPGTQSEEPPVRARQQGWKCRQQPCAAVRSHHFPHQRAPLAHTDPNSAQRHRRNTPTTLCSPSGTHSQAMWRPWS
ncbi:transcription factor HES-7.1-like [Anguilla anguilla]|uniref:transcription factor HES-7.1-like n=1 Tax=Anguilla anguilla TaxID=7936 RepID=UPI0015AC6452|nr:transcription factor HES-7.1-like [Anguilla anguilla]